MKGLLQKDLYLIRSYCRTMLIIDVVFLAVFLLGGEEVGFYLIFPCMLTGILPMTLFAYDEREKWDVIAQTLPIDRALLVTEKYLLVPLLLLPVGLVSLLVLLVKRVDLFDALSIALAIGLLAPSIILPFSFKLGTEKGRLAYYGVFALLFLAGSMLTSRGGALPQLPFSASPALLPVCALLIYLISWRLSVVFYQKREL